MDMESTDGMIVGVGDINQLPEECISHVISLTTPRDACVSSAVSRTFRSAADLDATWQRFLPSDYASLLSQAVEPVEYASKKDLYFRLCDHPVLIDGGKMSFGLDKSSGAKCFMISARALNIAWGEDRRYWKWISLPDSRFAEDGELLIVCWLDIIGKMECKILTPCTTYAAYFVFKLTHSMSGLSERLQETNIKLGGEIVSHHLVCLDPEKRQRNRHRRRPHPQEINEGNVLVPIARGDGWMEIEIGEFFIGETVDGEVEMSFTEKGGHGKSGLIVQGIEVRPKH